MQKTQAMALLTSHGRGPGVQRFLARLNVECDRLWRNGRRMCEAPSISGNPCIQPVHRLPSEEEDADSALPVLPHLSGVRYVSACSCGRRQVGSNQFYNFGQHLTCTSDRMCDRFFSLEMFLEIDRPTEKILTM